MAFHQGLSNSIKDELASRELGEDLQFLIMLAIRIDGCLRQHVRHCFFDTTPVVSVIRPTTVVSSANLMMVLESCLAVHGVQEGTEHAPLRGRRAEDQRGGCVVTYLYHLGAACQEVQDPVAEGGV